MPMQEYRLNTNKMLCKTVLYLYPIMSLIHIIYASHSNDDDDEWLLKEHYNSLKKLPDTNTVNINNQRPKRNHIPNKRFLITPSPPNTVKRKRCHDMEMFIKYEAIYNQLRQKVDEYYFPRKNEGSSTTTKHILKNMQSRLLQQNSSGEYQNVEINKTQWKKNDYNIPTIIHIAPGNKENYEVSECMINSPLDEDFTNEVDICEEITNIQPYEHEKLKENVHIKNDMNLIKYYPICEYSNTNTSAHPEQVNSILTDIVAVTKNEENIEITDNINNITFDDKEIIISHAKKFDTILTKTETILHKLFIIERENLLNFLKNNNIFECNLVKYYMQRQIYMIKKTEYNLLWENIINEPGLNFRELFDVLIPEKDTLFLIYQPFYMFAIRISKIKKIVKWARNNIERIIIFTAYLDIILRELKNKINRAYQDSPLSIDYIEIDQYYVQKTNDLNTLTLYILFEINLIYNNPIDKYITKIMNELNKISGVVLSPKNKNEIKLLVNTSSQILIVKKKKLVPLIWFKKVLKKLKKIIGTILKLPQADCNDKCTGIEKIDALFIEKTHGNFTRIRSMIFRNQRRAFISNFSTIFKNGLNENYSETKLFFMLFLSEDLKEMKKNITMNKLRIFMDSMIVDEGHNFSGGIECLNRIKTYTNFLYIAQYLHDNYEMLEYAKEFWPRIFYTFEIIIKENKFYGFIIDSSSLKNSDVVELYDLFLTIIDFQIHILPLGKINLIHVDN